MPMLKRFLKGVGLRQEHLGTSQDNQTREMAMALKPAGLSRLQKRFFQSRRVRPTDTGFSLLRRILCSPTSSPPFLQLSCAG